MLLVLEAKVLVLFDVVIVEKVLGVDGVPVAVTSVVGMELVKCIVDVGGIAGGVVGGGTTITPAPELGRMSVAIMAVCVGITAPGLFEHMRYAASTTSSDQISLCPCTGATSSRPTRRIALATGSDCLFRKETLYRTLPDRKARESNIGT